MIRKTGAVAALYVLAVACTDSPTPTSPGPLSGSGRVAASISGNIIPVTDISELYAAVSNPGNAGKTLLLRPGLYMLDTTKGIGGRLELLHDMSLLGMPEHPDSVIIDASALQVAHYALAGGAQTGALRVGRGANSITGMTVRNASNGAAAIEADLASVIPGRLTISRVIVYGNRRGIDIRNVGTAAAGHVITATITDSEIRDNQLQMGTGIRVLNAEGAVGGVISVTLARNVVTGNRIGCLIANNSVNYATISVSSDADRFDSNGIGCGLATGISTTIAANNNTLSFYARGSSFRNNAGPIPPGPSPRAGLTVEGGVSSLPGLSSFNTASVFLQNPLFGGNLEFDVRAWAARSTSPQPAGSFNTVSVVMTGAPGATVESTPSLPGPAGTNTLTVIK